MAKKNKKKFNKNYYTKSFVSFSVSPKEVHFIASQIFGSTYYISFEELSSSSVI